MFIGSVESFGPALMSLVIKETEKQDKLPSIETILPKQNSSNFSDKYWLKNIKQINHWI